MNTITEVVEDTFEVGDWVYHRHHNAYGDKVVGKITTVSDNTVFVVWDNDSFDTYYPEELVRCFWV